MKNLILMVIMLLCLTGCSEEKLYADYEHYDLKDKRIFTYNCLNDERIKQTYAIADITPNNFEGQSIRGLFYQVNGNDYILLDKIESGNYTEDENDKFNVINGNKLYAIGNLSSPAVVVYNLDGINTTKEELNFTLNNKIIIIESIDSIKNDNIYFLTYDNKIAECSLEDYTCEYIED